MLKFDFISSNYDFSNTVMDTHVQPYKIYIVDGIKIGVFGLGIQLDGLVLKTMYKETEYLNPIETTQEIRITSYNVCYTKLLRGSIAS